MPQLTQLYCTTIALPIRMHLFIVDGIGSVVPWPACHVLGVFFWLVPETTEKTSSPMQPSLLKEAGHSLPSTILSRGEVVTGRKPISRMFTWTCLEIGDVQTL